MIHIESKNKIDSVVIKETLYIGAWVLIFSAIMEAVFLAIGKWDYTVLLGSLLGSATAAGNFLLVGLMIQKALAQTEKQAKNTVRLSQGGRLLLQGVILVLAAVLPCFNIWAAAIPLLIPRVAVSIRSIQEAKKNPSPDRPAIGWEDEDDEDD